MEEPCRLPLELGADLEKKLGENIRKLTEKSQGKNNGTAGLKKRVEEEQLGIL